MGDLLVVDGFVVLEMKVQMGPLVVAQKFGLWICLTRLLDAGREQGNWWMILLIRSAKSVLGGLPGSAVESQLKSITGTAFNRCWLANTSDEDTDDESDLRP